MSLSPRPRASALRPKIVELVGLPGTGKSTVTKAMVAKGGGRIQETRVNSWRSAHLIMKNAWVLWPTFLNQYSHIERRRWNKFFLMIRLETLANLLASSRTPWAEVVLLDQGPVYMLSILQRALGDSTATGRGFQKYWDATLAQWSGTLDCVVLLEANDDVLYQRILERGTKHPVMNHSREDASHFFERARSSQKQILAKLRSQNGSTVSIHLRTDEVSLNDTIVRILEHLRTSAG